MAAKSYTVSLCCTICVAGRPGVVVARLCAHKEVQRTVLEEGVVHWRLPDGYNI